MKKQIKTITNHILEFSPEELQELNITSRDKFSCEATDDGIVLKKYETVEIDLNEFSKDGLIKLIIDSTEADRTIEEQIEYILTEVVEELDSPRKRYSDTFTELFEMLNNLYGGVDVNIDGEIVFIVGIKVLYNSEDGCIRVF